MKSTKTKRVTRSVSVIIRFRPDERAKIESAAKKRGLGISAWVRMAALDALAKDA